jgi:hypothetical protein
MQSNDNDEDESAAWRDRAPCCANVWDPVLGAYHPCDDWADPASESDLCTKHDERLTAIVSLINAAQTASRITELEEQPWEHPVP